MPDVVTASDEYALRFAGSAGEFLLSVQEETVSDLFSEYPPVAPGAEVLDHGGTHGQLAGLFHKHGFVRTVSASRETLIDRAEPWTPTRSGPLHRLPLEDRTFDAVVCVRLLAHASDTEAVVAEMCRLAKRSVIVDYPSKRSLNVFSGPLFQYKLKIEGDTRRFTSVSDRELQDMFARHGFKLVKQRRQFMIPMGLHRAAGDSPTMRGLERFFRATGLVRLIGNPAVARFDRLEGE